jgi:hypothetical protein
MAGFVWEAIFLIEGITEEEPARFEELLQNQSLTNPNVDHITLHQ